MNQKKTMKLWQMITILILSVAILATIFLPAYHINADTVEKGMENAQVEEDYYKSEEKKDKAIQKYVDRFNNAVEKEEKENGTDNASISVLKLMTSSLSDIRYNGKYDEEDTKSEMGEDVYDALNNKHFMTRILLWVVYGLILIVALFIILGYCLKWTKYIPLTISAVYGVLAGIIFAVLRFGTISGVKKEVGNLTTEFIGGRFKNIDSAKIAPSFISFAFLLGLIVAVVFLAVSVISMFVGDQTETAYDEGAGSDPLSDWNDGWDQSQQVTPDFKTVAEPEPDVPSYSGNTQGIAPFEQEQKGAADAEIRQEQPLPQTIQSTMSVQESAKKPAAVPSGKVRCTKGMTSGAPGYSLPQDRKVVVGKSPHQANLVIVNNALISNVHCTIRYDQMSDTYTVRDHSTNGTFVDGIRLRKEASMKYPAGTVLKLADGSVEITLG